MTFGRSLVIARAIAERMSGRMNPIQRIEPRSIVCSVFGARKKEKKGSTKEKKENRAFLELVNTYSIRIIPNLRVHTLSVERIKRTEERRRRIQEDGREFEEYPEG